MKTRRGDVVLVLFPNSDLRTAKRRPALVLQRDSLGAGLEQTIVAMISSNLARRGHPSRVFISAASREGKAAGVRLDSVVMTDNLATVLAREIDSVLGRLPNITAVDAALKHTLGICPLTSVFPVSVLLPSNQTSLVTPPAQFTAAAGERFRISLAVAGLPSHQTLNSGDDIRAALKFAGELVEQEEHHPLPA